MGLDTTIKRLDGQPLGDIETVKAALATAFPGIVFGVLPGGSEMIQSAAAKGIEFPEILKQHLGKSPAEIGGEYGGKKFSAQFRLGSSPIVETIDGVLYGKTSASEKMFRLLEEKFGWVTTHP